MTRIVQGLKWARVLDAWPQCIPASRARGAKAQGVRYERALARALPAAKHGQWFEFEDSNGRGFCQVDLMLQLANGVLVLEAKYTWTPEGHCQVEQLYGPVVGKAWGLPVRGLVVCKRLVPGMPGSVVVTGDLEGALVQLASGARVVLHWLGGTTLASECISGTQGMRLNERAWEREFE